jgi:hypothetical protein
MRCPLIIGLLLLASTDAAMPVDLSGQASIIDGDNLEIQGTRIRLWGIDAPESAQLCRGDDSLQYRCGAKSANDLDAFVGRRPVSCIPISLDQYGRTVAPVRWPEPISRNGWSATASRSTGRNIQSASTQRPSAMRSTPGAGCGRAAMLSRGFIVRASERAASRATARMMRMRIPDWRDKKRGNGRVTP